MANAQLTWLDWVIFALSLVISAAIGIYFALTGGRQKTTKEFLVGNRQLTVIPTSLSMIMSYISAIFILGYTAEVYLHGIQVFLGNIGQMMGWFITTLFFVPTFYRLRLVSAYEYLDKRFQSRRLRLVCVGFQLVSLTVYMGTAMYAPSTALEGVTGFPVWASLIIMFAVTIFYSTIGGIKAVIWTDAFQGIVMFAGIFAILILGINKVGGISRVWNLSKEGGRHNWFNLNPDPTQRMNLWVLIIGRIFYNIIYGGTSPNNVQRYCAMPTLFKARLTVIMTAIMLGIVGFIINLMGLVVFAYFYSIGCDPLRGKLVGNANQILPHFVVKVLNVPGLSGVFLAVLYSGALSSLSSAVSAMSAITWRDILQYRLKGLEESRKALVTKILVFVYGCIGVCVAFLIQRLPGHIMQIATRVLGNIGGPVSGVMALGIFVPFANALGGGLGALGGFAFTLWTTIGAYIFVPHRTYLYTRVENCSFATNVTALPMPTNPPAASVFPLYRMSFMLTPIIAVVSTMIFGMIISLLSGGEKPERRNPKNIVPLSHFFCCCCPKSVQRVLSCGLDDFKEQQDKEEEVDDFDIASDRKVGRSEGPDNYDTPVGEGGLPLSSISNGTVFSGRGISQNSPHDIPYVEPKDGVLLSYKELSNRL